MSFPAPESLLRHRDPALFVTAIEAGDGRSLLCTSTRAARWRWNELLDAAAQAAGVLYALSPSRDTAPRGRVVARYDAVDVLTHSHQGDVTWRVTAHRRVGEMRQMLVVGSHDGRPVLSAIVTLAPEPGGAPARDVR